MWDLWVRLCDQRASISVNVLEKGRHGMKDASSSHRLFLNFIFLFFLHFLAVAIREHNCHFRHWIIILAERCNGLMCPPLFLSCYLSCHLVTLLFSFFFFYIASSFVFLQFLVFFFKFLLWTKLIVTSFCEIFPSFQ